MANIAIINGKARMINEEIWQKKWFMQLQPESKLAYLYIYNTCDRAGVWDANFQLVEFTIGHEIDWNTLINSLKDQIIILPNGNWWMPAFIYYQCNKLSENSPAHKSYIKLLTNHGLIKAYREIEKYFLKGNPYPSDTLYHTLQEQEKEEEHEHLKKQEKEYKIEKVDEEDEDLPF